MGKSRGAVPGAPAPGAPAGQGGGVIVEPHLCVGCGACTTVCPSGAMSFAYPGTLDQGKRLRTLLTAYAKGGGRDAVLLLHSEGAGNRLVDELGYDYTAVGSLIGLYSLTGMFVALPAAMTGRRWGDGRMAAFGLGLMAVGGFLPELGSSWEVLAAGRIIAGTAIAVGAATAVAGAIGFIGLVAPHLVRPFVGYAPRRVLLPSALAGAVLLLCADIAARLVHTNPELRLGVFTSLLGTPFFFWLVVRIRKVAP